MQQQGGKLKRSSSQESATPLSQPDRSQESATPLSQPDRNSAISVSGFEVELKNALKEVEQKLLAAFTRELSGNNPQPSEGCRKTVLGCVQCVNEDEPILKDTRGKGSNGNEESCSSKDERGDKYCERRDDHAAPKVQEIERHAEKFPSQIEYVNSIKRATFKDEIDGSNSKVIGAGCAKLMSQAITFTKFKDHGQQECRRTRRLVNSVQRTILAPPSTTSPMVVITPTRGSVGFTAKRRKSSTASPESPEGVVDAPRVDRQSVVCGDFELDPFWSSAMVVSGDFPTELIRMHEGNSFKKTPNSSCGKMMQTPDSNRVIAGIALGSFFIMVDVLTLPLQLAGLVPVSLEYVQIKVVMLCFWAYDMISSFFTGFYVDAGIEMRFQVVARRYLKGWFLCDFVVLIVDIAVMVATFINTTGDTDGNSGVARLSKAGRAMRYVRIVSAARLLRVRRLYDMSSKWLDKVETEWKGIISRLFRLILSIILFNHYIACAFIGLAKSEESQTTWLDELIYQDNLHYYMCSFHWSITQFTPATQDIHPSSTMERAFSICVVLAALLTFSTLLGKMTSAMTQLLDINTKKRQEEGLMRRFLQDHNISESLRVKIWGCYRQQRARKVGAKIQETCVQYFRTMPERMQMQLHEELYAKYLAYLPIFQTSLDMDCSYIPFVCHLAISESCPSALEEIFRPDKQARGAICPIQGTLCYESKYLDADMQVEPCRWVCEAALWGKWAHKGLLTAEVASRCLFVDSAQLKAAFVIAVGTPVEALIREYVRSYGDFLSSTCMLDFPITKNECNFIWHLASLTAARVQYSGDRPSIGRRSGSLLNAVNKIMSAFR